MKFETVLRDIRSEHEAGEFDALLIDPRLNQMADDSAKIQQPIEDNDDPCTSQN